MPILLCFLENRKSIMKQILEIVRLLQLIVDKSRKHTIYQHIRSSENISKKNASKNLWPLYANLDKNHASSVKIV